MYLYFIVYVYEILKSTAIKIIINNNEVLKK